MTTVFGMVRVDDQFDLISLPEFCQGCFCNTRAVFLTYVFALQSLHARNKILKFSRGKKYLQPLVIFVLDLFDCLIAFRFDFCECFCVLELDGIELRLQL